MRDEIVWLGVLAGRVFLPGWQIWWGFNQIGRGLSFRVWWCKLLQVRDLRGIGGEGKVLARHLLLF